VGLTWTPKSALSWAEDTCLKLRMKAGTLSRDKTRGCTVARPKTASIPSQRLEIVASMLRLREDSSQRATAVLVTAQ